MRGLGQSRAGCGLPTQLQLSWLLCSIVVDAGGPQGWLGPFLSALQSSFKEQALCASPLHMATALLGNVHVNGGCYHTQRPFLQGFSLQTDHVLSPARFHPGSVGAER